MLRNDLLGYWPREEDVVACIKTDAEASDKAVLLAVHQPMRFERQVIGGELGTVDTCDEHELLRKFLSTNLPDGRVIVPIVGSSGIGKSHVIRWLDAQIRRLPGSERRVIIRIPKGMSLKGVLGILLKDLPGPAYDRFRNELLRAQEELEPEEAAGLLCEMLAHTITEMGVESRARLLKNPADKNAQECDAFCRADMLPALLRNQLLRDQHFVRTRDGRPGVIKRLVEQLTEDRDASADDDRQHLFTADDLLFDEALDRDALGRIEARALSQLEREDRRSAAARILNDALDDAKQRLLRLDPTVSELFDAVREELLKEQHELVLLVEDFAVLSGLQKQLLQVIIKEAFRDGRQVLCTMRTALAYTTGYMNTATVLTRANVEYRIPDEPGTEEEILARIERLVGAYLNAARFGQDSLKRAYRTSGQAAEDLHGWIPSFSSHVEPEARSTLDAFGTSVDGYELFPFNGPAIRELSREGCSPAGRLVYNPRFVIQNVINKVLDYRVLFEKDEFPPASFGAQGRPLPSRIAEEVRRRVPLAAFERYLRFLVYWGGFPGTATEINQIEPRVFTAFGLDRLTLSKDSSQAERPTATKTPPPPPGTSPGQSERARQLDPLETRWEAILEHWRGGATISQADANQLRKWIAEALKGFVEWDWDLHRTRRDAGLDSWFNWIYIPHSAGGEGRTAEDAMIAVCSDVDLTDQAKSAGIHSALMAIIRFHAVQKGSWDYANAEDDLPKYGAFLSKLAERARAFVQRRYFRADWNPIPALVEGLLIGSRALGIDTAGRDRDHAALIDAMFAIASDPAPANSATGGDPEAASWVEFTNTLRRCRRLGEKELRDELSWQGHLLNLIGARQGQADMVHAIDVMRLKSAIDKVVGTWEFSETLPNPSGVPDFSSVRTTYSELKKLSTAVTKAQRRLVRWRDQTLTWLGEGFDKEAMVREAKETVESARAAGLTIGMDTKLVFQLLEDFRNTKVVPALDDLGKIVDGAPRGVVLTVLGRDHESVVRLCDELQLKLDEILRSVEAKLASESLTYGTDPFAEAVSSLSNELVETGRELEKVDRL
jgi:hypothetical protein